MAIKKIGLMKVAPRVDYAKISARFLRIINWFCDGYILG